MYILYQIRKRSVSYIKRGGITCLQLMECGLRIQRIHVLTHVIPTRLVNRCELEHVRIRHHPLTHPEKIASEVLRRRMTLHVTNVS